MAWQFITTNSREAAVADFNTAPVQDANEMLANPLIRDKLYFSVYYHNRYNFGNNKQFRAVMLPYALDGIFISTNLDSRHISPNTSHEDDNKWLHQPQADRNTIDIQIKYTTCIGIRESYAHIKDSYPNDYNGVLNTTLMVNSSKPCCLWYDAATNKVLLFTTAMTPSVLFKLYALLPNLLPGLLKTPIRPEYWYALGKLDSAAFANEFALWFNRACLSFKETLRKEKIRSAFKLLADKQVQQLNNRVNSTRSRLNDAEQAFRNLFAELTTAEKDLIFHEHISSNTALQEAVAYYQAKPQVASVAVNSNGSLRLVLRAPCDYYDAALVVTMLNSSRTNSLQHARIRNFFQRVFIDQEFRLYLSGAFDIMFGSHEFIVLKDGYVTPVNSIPNCHLKGFRCTGGYHSQIAKAAKEYNYIMTIENLIMSVGNMNFGDGPVLSRWLEYLFNSSEWRERPCCEKDGAWFTVAEVNDFTPEQIAERINEHA